MDKIKKVAKARYEYDLVDDKILSLDSEGNKLALLREICLKVGIKLKGRNYNSGGKQSKGLNFKKDDVVEMFPVLKHIDISNADIKSYMNAAKSAFKEGYYE